MSMTVIGYFAKDYNDNENFIFFSEGLLIANDKIELRKLSKVHTKGTSWVIEQIYCEDIMYGMDHGATYTLTNDSFLKFKNMCIEMYPEYFTYDRVNFINVQGRDFVKLN